MNRTAYAFKACGFDVRIYHYRTRECGVGARLDDVAADMIALADRLGIQVTTRFNGHHVYANPGDGLATIIASYQMGVDFDRLRMRKSFGDGEDCRS